MKNMIRLYPDPILSKIATPIVFDRVYGKQKYTPIVNFMYDVVKEEKGIGLAAPQIGISERLFVFSHPEGTSIITAFNPVLKNLKDFEEIMEGCLSLPEFQVKVKRAKKLTLEAFDIDGMPFTQELEGIAAHACQHELDHLNGHLLINYLGSAGRFMHRKKFERLEKLYSIRLTKV